MAKRGPLVIGNLTLGGDADSLGCVEAQTTSLSSIFYTWVDRGLAISIINHLKTVFDIEDDATQALKLECVKQIWDHRKCPSCGHSFIPLDRARQETLDTLNALFPNDPMRGGGGERG